MRERQRGRKPGISYTEKCNHQIQLSKYQEWPRNKTREASGLHELWTTKFYGVWCIQFSGTQGFQINRMTKTIGLIANFSYLKRQPVDLQLWITILVKKGNCIKRQTTKAPQEHPELSKRMFKILFWGKKTSKPILHLNAEKNPQTQTTLTKAVTDKEQKTRYFLMDNWATAE